MIRRARKAAVGGTFDRIHRGHEALLRAAFESARSVGIGLTTDAYLALHPKPGGDRIRSYPTRRAHLERYLRRNFPLRTYEIVPLRDPMGGALGPDVDTLVLSEETAPALEAINRVRRRRGLLPLRSVVVPIVRGADLQPIAGRRIREGTIDSSGRRLVPLSIAVTANDPTMVPAFQRAFLAELGGVAVQLRERPWPHSPRAAGGSARARVAVRLIRGRSEYAVALWTTRSGRARLADETSDGSTVSVHGGVDELTHLVRRLVRSRRG